MEQQQSSIKALQQELEALQTNKPKTGATETADQQSQEQITILGLRGMFDQLLSDQERQPALVAATNTIQKCCRVCYLTQAIGNDSCTLCGSTPETWLLAEDDKPTTTGWSAYEERKMFKRMAANSTVEELKTALRSGWASTDEREQFAKRLLELREAQTRRAQQPKAEEQPASVPAQGITNGQVQSAIRWCDLQLEKLDQEMAGLKAKR